jgi:hypothetical protein
MEVIDRGASPLSTLHTLARYDSRRAGVLSTADSVESRQWPNDEHSQTNDWPRSSSPRDLDEVDHGTTVPRDTSILAGKPEDGRLEADATIGLVDPQRSQKQRQHRHPMPTSLDLGEGRPECAGPGSCWHTRHSILCFTCQCWSAEIPVFKTATTAS